MAKEAGQAPPTSREAVAIPISQLAEQVTSGVLRALAAREIKTGNGGGWAGGCMRIRWWVNLGGGEVGGDVPDDGETGESLQPKSK